MYVVRTKPVSGVQKSRRKRQQDIRRWTLGSKDFEFIHGQPPREGTGHLAPGWVLATRTKWDQVPVPGDTTLQLERQREKWHCNKAGSLFKRRRVNMTCYWGPPRGSLSGQEGKGWGAGSGQEGLLRDAISKGSPQEWGGIKMGKEELQGSPG